MTRSNAKRLVIYRSKVYEVRMPYSHELELRGEEGVGHPRGLRRSGTGRAATGARRHGDVDPAVGPGSS